MSLIQNKKLHLNYEIKETLEAGLKLTGNEVKAIRSGQAQIDGAKIIIRGGEAFVVGLQISSYQNQKKINPPSSDNNKNKIKIEESKINNQTSDRIVKLLLNKNEIFKLHQFSEKGFQLQAEKIYTVHGLLKLQIAVGKRKKKADKRETIRQKDFKRDDI